MKVINHYGGPGTGKSTTAADVFARLKHLGHKVELVTEYAKELCYQGTLPFTSQLQIFTEQLTRLERLRDQVDYVVTDSPILLSTVYGKDMPAWFEDAVWERYYSFDNFDVFLNRVKPYAKYGRGQTEDEAKLLDVEIKTLLDQWWEYDGDKTAAGKIIEDLNKY